MVKNTHEIRADKNHTNAGRCINFVALLLILLLACVAVWTLVIKPNASYSKAQKLLDEGQYREAIDIFSSLGNYKDAATMVDETRYQMAQWHLNNGDPATAEIQFAELGNYKDSCKYRAIAVEYVISSQYAEAISLYESKLYEDALYIFETIATHKNSAEFIFKCKQKMIQATESSVLNLFAMIDYETSVQSLVAITGDDIDDIYKTGGGEDFDSYRLESKEKYTLNGIPATTIFEFKCNKETGNSIENTGELTSMGWYCPRELETYETYQELKSCVISQVGAPTEESDMKTSSVTKTEYCYTRWNDLQLYYSIDNQDREEIRLTRSSLWK